MYSFVPTSRLYLPPLRFLFVQLFELFELKLQRNALSENYYVPFSIIIIVCCYLC